ncbi:MAG: type II toxin-antitoxin system VapC family toxin [Methylobacillus sp.]|jgi:tRNA(fMet)-specific endonuclease VapC|nr:type II toxin-antitoxin system VapC family toxin [Methylobacillus sp.]
MIKRMLDTNICIYLINQQPPEVIHKFSEYRKGEIVISAITWGEVCCGINKHGQSVIAALLDYLDVIPFDFKASEIFSALSIKHPNRKANFDRLIAAHAIAVGVPLVTNNTADFALYQSSGLAVENWVGV